MQKIGQLWNWYLNQDNVTKVLLAAVTATPIVSMYYVVKNRNIPRVSAVYVYPIKSCGGKKIVDGVWPVVKTGLKYDRQWMVVDLKGRFITQRQKPKMSQIETDISLNGDLTIKIPSKEDSTQNKIFTLKYKSTYSKETTVEVWGTKIQALDCGDTVAKIFSDYLGMEVRLVQYNDNRRVNQQYAKIVTDYEAPKQVAFGDGFPFLLVTERSILELQSKANKPLEVNRFRPNIVVRKTNIPYEEDFWNVLSIGNLKFQNVKCCTRCTIPSINPLTGTKDHDITELLQKNRSNPSDPTGPPLFGINLCHLKEEGQISVGMLVRVQSHHNERPL